MMQVVPNPYKTLDADGKPIAVFPCHYKHAPGRYVGASMKLDVTQEATFVQIKTKRGVRREVAQFDRSRAVFTFAFEPVQVPADGERGAYYRKGVQKGVLLPADRATATWAGVEFVPVEQALQAQRDAAAKEFKRQTGELPAWAATETQQPAPSAAPN